jgi:hydrogenase maturation protease
MPEPSCPGSVAVIGVGNLLRGDDGAGILVVRELRKKLKGGSVETLESGGDVTQLLDCFDRFSVVFIVDAVRIEDETSQLGDNPARVFRVNALNEELPVGERAASSHVLGVAQAVALGRLLGKLPRVLEVWGLESRNFVVGAEPGKPVLRAVNEAAKSLAFEVNRYASQEDANA